MFGLGVWGRNCLGSGNQAVSDSGGPNRRAKWVDDFAARPTLQKFAGVLRSIAGLTRPRAGGRNINGAQQCSATRTKDALIIRRHFGGHFRLAFSAPHQASCRNEFPETRIRNRRAIYGEFRNSGKTSVSDNSIAARILDGTRQLQNSEPFSPKLFVRQTTRRILKSSCA